jgi:hypothetical protein
LSCTDFLLSVRLTIRANYKNYATTRISDVRNSLADILKVNLLSTSQDSWMVKEQPLMISFLIRQKRPDPTQPDFAKCPRTYCQGYWAGYRVGWNNELDGDANGQCFPGMQQLILVKCISGVRIDSKDYGVGSGQATTDFYNPVKGTNNERTICALGSRDNCYRWPINSTNACYAGYYDRMCYDFYTCNKYNPIKPIQYPTTSIPLLPAPRPENSQNGTFIDPTSVVLQRFTDIGTIIGIHIYWYSFFMLN